MYANSTIEQKSSRIESSFQTSIVTTEKNVFLSNALISEMPFHCFWNLLMSFEIIISEAVCFIMHW